MEVARLPGRSWVDASHTVGWFDEPTVPIVGAGALQSAGVRAVSPRAESSLALELAPPTPETTNAPRGRGVSGGVSADRGIVRCLSGELRFLTGLPPEAISANPCPPLFCAMLVWIGTPAIADVISVMVRGRHLRTVRGRVADQLIERDAQSVRDCHRVLE